MLLPARRSHCSRTVALVLAGAVATTVGCAAPGSAPLWREGAPRPSTDGPGDLERARRSDVEPVRNLPKSRIGNAPSYEVFGQRYAVLDSAAGFTEQGIASWYGAKFHGRDTSSGETYDMHLMSAAHKHLPLPTFVRVTRTDTGQSIVVKVNDRGPFVDDRIIDLSYAAADRLDMLGSGTAPVVIEALTSHEVLADADAPQPAGRAAAAVAVGSWIQIGAFADAANARAALERVAGSTGLGGRVELDARDALYRVRLGPVLDEAAHGEALSALASAGVESYTMVPASP